MGRPFAGVVAGVTVTGSPTRELTLLHTNDLHDRRAVFAVLEAYPRDPSTLLVDAGDAIRGSNTVFRLHEPILDAMSRVGYDAMTFGNREFNYLRGVLNRRHAQVTFPFVCANVHDLRGKVNHLWQPTLVKQVGGARVGIIGLTPVQYLEPSYWQPLFGFQFLAPLEVLPPLVASLRSRVDAVVLLSHSGFDADCQIARAVEGIDVIVGGHSHTLLETPRRIGATAIVQTGAYGRFIGKMRLRAKEGGTVEVIDYGLIATGHAAVDDAAVEPRGAA